MTLLEVAKRVDSDNVWSLDCAVTFSSITEIKTKKEYELALNLIHELIDDYDNNLGLIEVISGSIERLKNIDKSFSYFN